MKKKILITFLILLIPTFIVVISLYSSGVSQQTSIEWVKSNNGSVEFEIKGWAESIPFEDTKNLIGKKVTSVSLNDSTIGNLSKLEVFKDCEVLKIQNCTIENFSSVGKLKQIKKLQFIDSNIKDITFLIEFTNLEHLELTNTLVHDLTALEKLKTLKTLNLMGSEVKNIVPLKDLEQIEVLDLSSTKVENILPLQSLKNLKDLQVNNTEVTLSQVNYIQKALQNCTVSSDKL